MGRSNVTRQDLVFDAFMLHLHPGASQPEWGDESGKGVSK